MIRTCDGTKDLMPLCEDKNSCALYICHTSAKLIFQLPTLRTIPAHHPSRKKLTQKNRTKNARIIHQGSGEEASLTSARNILGKAGTLVLDNDFGSNFGGNKETKAFLKGWLPKHTVRRNPELAGLR